MKQAMQLTNKTAIQLLYCKRLCVFYITAPCSSMELFPSFLFLPPMDSFRDRPKKLCAFRSVSDAVSVVSPPTHSVMSSSYPWPVT